MRSGRDRLLLAASEKGLGSPEAGLIIEAARALGVEAREVRWDTMEIPDVGAPESLFIRHTWDYHRRIEEFRTWLDALERAGARVHNSVRTVRWNLDKGYLDEMAEAGIPTPRTLYVAEGEPPPGADEVLDRIGSERVVIKPTVSATSWQTRLVDVADSDAVAEATRKAAEGGRAMIQEFLPEIAQGEWSVLYMGGDFSHAVLKSPLPGEFRCQVDFGGSADRLDVPAQVRAAADRCIEWLPERPTFARVDGVVTERGFLLMELELIEPDLFLRLHPPAAKRLVELAIG